MIGISTLILDNGNATFTLLALPLGIYLITTKQKVIYNNGKFTGKENNCHD